jgi:hypothetical protein
VSCGPIHAGGATAATPNDSVPSGTVVAQGSFSATLNGKSLSGVVIIYSSSGNYILRLQGISVSNDNNLSIIVYDNGNVAYSTSLRAFSGNQNYNMGTSNSNPNFTSVTVHNSSTNLDYGTAVLTTPGSH